MTDPTLMTFVAKLIKDFNNLRHYRNDDTLFVKQLREIDLSETQIARVLVALNNICTSCMDATKPCNCTRDD